MQPLVTLPRDGYRPILPGGLDHAAAHQALAALLRDTMGAEVTGFFAPVSATEQGLSFFAPEGRVARFAELDATGRERLRAEIGRIISEARRGAALAAAKDPARAVHLPALLAAAIEIPGFDHVFAHEGRPVLAGWGMAPANAPGGLGLLRDLDDGKPAEAPVRVPMPALGAAFLAVFLLGAIAAFAFPYVARGLAPEPPMCRVEQGDLDAMHTLLREREREREIRHRLAGMEEDLGRRRAECALPEPPPPPPPPPPPAPEPSRQPEPTRPPPPPSLPAERWERGDLGLLAGCWELGAEAAGQRTWPNGRVEACRIPAGRICFGENGRGTRQDVFSCPSGDVTCNASLSASFSGGVLRLTNPAGTCVPGGTRAAETMTCTRVSDVLARCVTASGDTLDFRRTGGRP
ncbi:MAG: hypothetical protein ING24_08245 [Roseomonas sp.]|nr:hypothetical protein [Roseomonas sp.]MCA3342416.1 hypothetical protein [Roseomonas sp.]